MKAKQSKAAKRITKRELSKIEAQGKLNALKHTAQSVAEAFANATDDVALATATQIQIAVECGQQLANPKASPDSETGITDKHEVFLEQFRELDKNSLKIRILGSKLTNALKYKRLSFD